MDDAQTLNQAVVLQLAGCAEELQGDMPRIGAGPTETVARPLEVCAKAGELFGYLGCERDCDKQTHAIRARQGKRIWLTKKKDGCAELRASQPRRGAFPCDRCAIHLASGQGRQEAEFG